MATEAPRSVLGHAGKNWDASVVERDLYEWWERSGFFTPPEHAAPGERPFVMMLPLPKRWWLPCDFRLAENGHSVDVAPSTCMGAITSK